MKQHARQPAGADRSGTDPVYAQLVQYARDLQKLLKRQRAASAPERGRPAGANGAASVQIVGESAAIGSAVDACHRVAAMPTPVLLLGETGTGKELAARLIHDRSANPEAPFLALNCAALPESLVESELFGHEAGAFTNASHQHRGVFERAGTGTLLLDEVGELPLRMQAKLLRVLENRELSRVGGTETVPFRARVIAATNRDLEREVAANRFREDLYYRLNVFTIVLPPLAARHGDVALLTEHFLAQLARVGGRHKPISAEALRWLEQYTWPGNVRELRNVLERSYVIAEDRIEPEHLPPAVARFDRPGPVPSASVIEQQERLMVVKALEANNWNKAAAARDLSMSWDNLRYRIKKYGLQRAG
ncbi:MAG: sigma 54-interacting transcriptional regulator [Phycisphaeraceae bacterium]